VITPRPHKVLDQVFDLFLSLHATDEQLDFPIVYTSAKQGYARMDIKDTGTTMEPLFDTIISKFRRPARMPVWSSRCW